VTRRFGPWLIAGALFVSFGLGLAGQNPPPAPLRLLTTAGSRPLPTMLVNDIEMIAVDDLAAIFQVTLREDTLAHALTLTARGKTIVLTPDQSIASVAGRLVSLPAPPARIGGRWYVPMEFAPRALSLVLGTKLDLRKGSRLLIAGDLRVPRVVVRRELPGNGARLILDIAPPTRHTVTQEAGRLLVRFEADAIDATLPALTPDGWIQALRGTEPQPGLLVELGPRFGGFRTSDAAIDPTIARLTIDVLSTPEIAPPTTAAPAPSEMAPIAPTPAPGLRTVVIDPGHGGADTGAKGASGTLEKDVTLAIARRAKTSLEARLNARVLLTRDGDADVALDARASLANNNKADLFVSVHASGSVRPSAMGAQVFYAAVAQDASMPASGESGTLIPVFGGGTREIDIVRWDRAQARYLGESTAAARLFEAALRTVVPMNPRAVQQAPLLVLVGANMPAVLVEVGYLTNAEQDAQLRGGETQGRLAQAIADAIVRFDARDRAQPVGVLPEAAR